MVILFANIKKRLPKLELLDSLFCFFVLRGAAAKEWEQQRAIETAVGGRAAARNWDLSARNEKGWDADASHPFSLCFPVLTLPA